VFRFCLLTELYRENPVHASVTTNKKTPSSERLQLTQTRDCRCCGYHVKLDWSPFCGPRH